MKKKWVGGLLFLLTTFSGNSETLVDFRADDRTEIDFILELQPTWNLRQPAELYILEKNVPQLNRKPHLNWRGKSYAFLTDLPGRTLLPQGRFSLLIQLRPGELYPLDLRVENRPLTVRIRPPKYKRATREGLFWAGLAGLIGGAGTAAAGGTLFYLTSTGDAPISQFLLLVIGGGFYALAGTAMMIPGAVMIHRANHPAEVFVTEE